MPDEHSFELLGLYVMEMLLCLDRSGIFVCESLRVNDGISTDIADTLTYIAQNYRLPLSLEEVAGQINLSPTYLSKIQEGHRRYLQGICKLYPDQTGCPGPSYHGRFHHQDCRGLWL